MRLVRLLPLVALVALLALAAPAAALPPGFQATSVLSGVKEPTSVRFAPSGTKLWVAEKRGTVEAFDDADDTTPTQVVDLRTETYNFWDRGLLGLAVDPEYPVRPYLYSSTRATRCPAEPRRAGAPRTRTATRARPRRGRPAPAAWRPDASRG